LGKILIKCTKCGEEVHVAKVTKNHERLCCNCDPDRKMKLKEKEKNANISK